MFLRNLNKVLAITGKRPYYATLASLVVASLLEVGGVAVFYPYLDFLLNPAKIQLNPISRWTFETFRLSSQNQFLVLFGVVAILSVILSGCMGAYSKVTMNRYIWDANITLTRWLYTKYLKKAYVDIRQMNSDTIAKNVLNEVSIFTNGLLVPWSEFTSRLVVVTVWTGLLLAVSPYATAIVISGTAGIYLGIFGSLRRNLAKMSDQRFQMQEELFDYVNSSFRAIKDIKVNQSEAVFIEKIERPARLFSSLNQRMTLISQLPRYFIESFLFSTAVVVLLFYVGTDTIGTLIPVLSLYSMAAFRMIPHVQNLFASLARIRFNVAALELIVAEINTLSTREDEKTPGTNWETFKSLLAKAVGFKFPNADEYLLRGADFEVRAGQLVAIVGKSGSGKSTFVEVLLGLLSPTEGLVLCNGMPLREGAVLTSRVNLGYVSQEVVLFEGTLRENICLHRAAQTEDEHLIRVMETACVTEVVQSLGGSVDGNIVEGGKNLSAGQRQRVALARALFRSPDILVLDEATSALDRATEREVMTNLQRMGITVIMITHHAALAELADCSYEFVAPSEAPENGVTPSAELRKRVA